jgi:hypothetical protein
MTRKSKESPAAQLGRMGGRALSAAKVQAARENGKKGGREREPDDRWGDRPMRDEFRSVNDALERMPEYDAIDERVFLIERTHGGEVLGVFEAWDDVRLACGKLLWAWGEQVPPSMPFGTGDFIIRQVREGVTE